MKILRNGQAAIISDVEYNRIRRNINQLKYKIMLDIAWYTGERWGAICQLKVSDVYFEGDVRESITFRSSTRKRLANKAAQTRQVPIHPNLKEVLQNYNPGNSSDWLFPGKNEKPITWRNVYNVLTTAAGKAGLGNKGISTHSTRRSFITKLHNQGTSIATIKKITGHRDLKSLERYIEINSDQVKGAIYSL